MQFIKGGFSFHLKSKFDVWERSFNESQISAEEKFISCVRYIEENPIRRGLASTGQDYPFCSAARRALDPMPTHLRELKSGPKGPESQASVRSLKASPPSVLRSGLAPSTRSLANYRCVFC
jgi:hypothetical protein